MRTTLVLTLMVVAMAAFGQTETISPPEQYLETGIVHYRAGRYAEAVEDLNASTQGFLSSSEMQTYVSTGKFSKLAEFETALIYLALAQKRLGNETEAREAVLRLLTAEKIEPAYSRLRLAADASEFEQLAAALVPGAGLGTNTALAEVGSSPPQPERTRLAEQMEAQECARIQREAEERIVRIQREADDRIAAAEFAAATRIAEVERAANARVAEAEAAALRAREQQAAAAARGPIPPPVSRPATPPMARGEVRSRDEWADLLRNAHELADAGRFGEAAEIYRRIALSGAARDLRVEGAIGLYRTRAYNLAAEAFDGLAPFVRGEEDLRYYNAVSLFETGQYVEARSEFICALPFIEQTDDVIRYRSKIEQMVVWHMAQPTLSAAQ